MKKGFLFYVLLLPILVSFSNTLLAQAPSTIIFQDDFNRQFLGTNWNAAASWSIVDGAAYNFLDGIASTLKTASKFKNTSYSIETSAKGFSDGYKREFRLTFGQSSLLTDNMYVLKYINSGGGKLSLSRSESNIYYPEVLAEVAVYPILSSLNWQKIKIVRYKSGLMQVYIDRGEGYPATPLLKAVDTTYSELGYFGWQEDTQSYPEGFYIDWITATTLDKEKPPVKETEEDDLITQVTAKSGKQYKVAKLKAGAKAYIDRPYTITEVPTYLSGASFIQTAMNDKVATAADAISCIIKKEAIVYVGYDPRATVLPEWLKGWTKTEDKIFLTDPGSDHLDVYSKMVDYKDVYAQPFIVGGNLNYPASGAKMNYLLAVIERPKLMRLQAEDALLSGVVVAKNHVGYEESGFADYINPANDFIEWTVPIDVPGSYNIGIKYSNGSKKDRELKVTIDETDLGIFTFSPTWNWNSWAFYTGQEVYLKKGIYKIKATAIGTSGPNVDLLSMYFISPKHKETTTVAARRAQQPQQPAINTNYVVKTYPNPFATSTRIFYSLQKSAAVKLSVYAIDGRQVAELANGVKEAGNYNATFNATQLPAGVYIYRLQMGNEIKVGRLIKDR